MTVGQKGEDVRPVACGCGALYIEYVPFSPTIMQPASSDKRVTDVLDAIIDGRTVTRSRHELNFDGQDLTARFIERLIASGYVARTVGKVVCDPGERVPAFYLEERVAYFGWVFWEQFTTWRLRKLWGSVVKNPKGDWKIQLPASRSAIIYANETLKLEMDIDHPVEI